MRYQGAGRGIGPSEDPSLAIVELPSSVGREGRRAKCGMRLGSHTLLERLVGHSGVLGEVLGLIVRLVRRHACCVLAYPCIRRAQ